MEGLHGSSRCFTGAKPPDRFNLAAYCLGGGAATPGKPALIVSDGAHAPQIWTYAALRDAVLRAAFLLAANRGLKPQSRVLIRLCNEAAYPLAFFGAIAGGLIAIPASPDLTARELDALIEDSAPEAIILDDSLPHGLLPQHQIISRKSMIAALESGSHASFADTRASDPAFLIYTSGTTSLPKGVLHAQRSAWGRRPMYQGWYGINPQDRMLHAGGFNWTYTLGTGLMDPWANGATAIVHTGEKTLDLWPHLIRDHGVTLFAASPGVFRQTLRHEAWRREAMPFMRHGLCAGETLPQTLADAWREQTGTALYQALGQSEISTYISTSPFTPHKPGMTGKPQPGRSVMILPEAEGVEPLPPGEAGLIAVHRSDPGLMLGYWRRPDEEARMFRGAWFLGGDAGVLDDEGYIAHLGRRNELMNAGGFRVSPLEIEQELARHEGVQDVASAEVEVRPGVSIIAAFIVPSAPAVERAALAAFAESRLARYKQPREYMFVKALPRTANGKLKRVELPALFKREHGKDTSA